MFFILRSKGGNYLCLRDFQGEPQYYLSTQPAGAYRYATSAAALHGATLGAEALVFKISFSVVTVSPSEGF